MRKIAEYIGYQFGNPKGWFGGIACKIMNVINRKMYNSLIGELNLKENANLLEIGYGNGYFIKKIYKKFSPIIYGIDISEDSKKMAMETNKNITENRLFLDIGDICNLQYGDNMFHSVVTINTIYFWEDTEKGLKEIYRTLSDDGVFYNVVYSKKWLEKLPYTKKGFKLFDEKQYVEEGKRVGFSSVKITHIVNGKNYIVVYSK